MQLQVPVIRNVLRASVVTALLGASGCRKAEESAAVPEAMTTTAKVTVYVPCGMDLPFMGLKKAFEAAHPEVKADIVLDNGGIIVKRIIEKGEQPDVAVSPGTLEMRQLVAADKVAPADVHRFSRYELMLFVPRDNPGQVEKIADMADPRVKALAFPDPKVSSLGLYSRQVLTKLGLWKTVKAKSVFTEHPIVAYKYVARGKALASFAYRSCPLNTAPDKLAYSKVRILEKVPINLYDPAYGSIGILAGAPRRDLAEEFVALVLSPEGQAILAKYDVPVVTELNIFVPCGMTSAFFKIRKLYEATHERVSLRLEFDRADALTKRIVEGGAAPDVHLSIGNVETDILVRKGAVAKSAPVPFGRFRLALCAHLSRLKTLRTLADLAKPEIKTIVLTRPEESSVGAYTKTALRKLGLWEKVSPKIVYKPTIKDCYKELSAGKADAGFAYLGCPLPADPKKADFSKVKVVEVVDEKLYGGAIAFASVLKNSTHAAAAREFVTFLKTPEARKELETVGLLAN
ncbi:MAG: molybdate ABC transporter substrate-binding protein [Kiritimatiellaeota bacterium]|nr:molybdate ABC transporter substrate-binding protein [Kiritimatiellota bacterium]